MGAEGLAAGVQLLNEHPRLAIVNARILVRDESRLDEISAEMADSPLLDHEGIPGTVLVGFMAGAIMTIGGMPWALKHRRPMEADLDAALTVLDRRHLASRRALFNRTDPIRHKTRSRRALRPESTDTDGSGRRNHQIDE